MLSAFITFSQVNDSKYIDDFDTSKIEKKIELFIQKNIDSYKVSKSELNEINNNLHFESCHANHKGYSLDERKEIINLAVENYKKDVLRKIFFEENPDLLILLKTTNSTSVCSNSGFEDGLTADYTFKRRIVNAGQHLPGTGCSAITSGEINLFPSFIPPSTLNTFNADASLVSNQNEPFLLANCGININTTYSGTRAIKLNPTPATAAEIENIGNITVMNKSFIVDGDNISFKFLHYGLRVPSGSNFHGGSSFRYRLYNANNSILREKCYDINDINCIYNTINGITFSGWICENIDVEGLNGVPVRLEFFISDCQRRGDWGTVYIDDICNTTTCPSTMGSVKLTPQYLLCPTTPVNVCGTIQFPSGYTASGNINVTIRKNGTYVTNFNVTPTSPTANNFCFNVNPSIFGANPSGAIEIEVSLFVSCLGDNIILTNSSFNIMSYNNCCPIDRYISNSTNPPQSAWASNSITASNTLQLYSIVGDYNYQANNFVILVAGFSATTGSEFRAFIAPCPSTWQKTNNTLLENENNVNEKYIYKFENKNEPLDEELIIFPNPTNDIININSNSSKIIKIQVYGSDGRLVFDQNEINLNSFVLDMIKYTNGLYLIKINTEYNSNIIKKIIKK